MTTLHKESIRSYKNCNRSLYSLIVFEIDIHYESFNNMPYNVNYTMITSLYTNSSEF